MTLGIQIDKHTAKCDNGHQEIIYTWNEQTFWECPICNYKTEELTDLENEVASLESDLEEIVNIIKNENDYYSDSEIVEKLKKEIL